MQRKREHFLQLPMHQFSLPCSQQIVEMIYTILNVAFYTQGVTLNDLQLKDRGQKCVMIVIQTVTLPRHHALSNTWGPANDIQCRLAAVAACLSSVQNDNQQSIAVTGSLKAERNRFKEIESCM